MFQDISISLIHPFPFQQLMQGNVFKVKFLKTDPIQHWCYGEPARMSHDLNTRFYVAKVERSSTLKK
ncbi:hypothetical protein V8046_004361 [Vibrio parahaemolyticus]|nr:hypothetical protein [Vibrio parahaemolyticus]EMD9685698.1 hypothetical protein [Vibrio parahaemolyticus]